MGSVEGRFDDRLAANGNELLSASDLVLTTWHLDEQGPAITAEVRATEPRPGPLVCDGGRVAWGAVLLGAPLRGAPLPGAPLPGAPLPGAPLPGAPLPGAPLPGAPLPGAPLPG
ncbi:MAG TPA: hypothetical protein VME46_22115, partial [Acidimicrobiales bacterium]|nr:hypothetical protein [Acidimicrobiales bacterium]